MQDREDQETTGLSLAVLAAVAESAKLQYEIIGRREVTRALQDVELELADIAVGPISITAARARSVQFTQPYYQSSLGILAPAGGRLLDKVKPFLTKTFLTGFGLLVLVLLVAGAALWGVETKRNPEHFPSEAASGIGKCGQSRADLGKRYFS